MWLNHHNPSTIHSLWAHTYYCDLGENKTRFKHVCWELTGIMQELLRRAPKKRFALLHLYCLLAKGQFAPKLTFHTLFEIHFGIRTVLGLQRKLGE